jgi:hypothetical protein
MLGLRNIENQETQIIILKKGQRNKSLWKFIHCWNVLRESAYKKLALNRDTLISAYEKDFSLKKMLVTKLIAGNVGLTRAAFDKLTQNDVTTSKIEQCKVQAFVISILEKSKRDLTIAYYSLKQKWISIEIASTNAQSVMDYQSVLISSLINKIRDRQQAKTRAGFDQLIANISDVSRRAKGKSQCFNKLRMAQTVDLALAWEKLLKNSEIAG